MHNMFRAIRRVLDEHPDVKAIYPIHMNPVVRKAADEEMGDLMILATPGQHSCNTRTTVPITSGQAFLNYADIHS